MAYEDLGDGGFVVTGEHIDMYRFLAVKAGLKIESCSGMKMRRGTSLLKIAQQDYGVQARTKKGAYEEMQAMWDSMLEQRKADNA